MSDGDPPDIEGWKAHMLNVAPPSTNGHIAVEGQDGMQLDAETLNGAVSPDTRGAQHLFALSHARAASPSPVTDGGLTEPTAKDEVLSRAPSPAPSSTASAVPSTSTPAASQGDRTLRARSRSPMPSSSPALDSTAANASSSKPNSSVSTLGRATRKSRSPVPPVETVASHSRDVKSAAVQQQQAPPQITHTASSPVTAKQQNPAGRGKSPSPASAQKPQMNVDSGSHQQSTFSH